MLCLTVSISPLTILTSALIACANALLEFVNFFRFYCRVPVRGHLQVIILQTKANMRFEPLNPGQRTVDRSLVEWPCQRTAEFWL